MVSTETETFSAPTNEEVADALLDLMTEGIYGFPITRTPDGTVIHPPTYAIYKNNPSEEALRQFISQSSSANGIAVIAGVKHLCCIDFDLKNTSDKEIFNKWKANLSAETLTKCYIERTRNGGYHVFFFCPGFSFDAQPAANEEGRAVIEFFCKQNKIIYTYPTPGYTQVHNELLSVGELSQEEATNLLLTAELFNCYKGKIATYTPGSSKKLAYPKEKQTLFEDFDYRVDSDRLIDRFCLQTGWANEYDQKRNEFKLWHPQTSVKARSAVYSLKFNRLIVFSESQKLFPSFCSYDPKNPTPYVVTPTHILYALLDDFDEVEKEIRRLLPPKVPLKIKRWLLSYVDKDYLKETWNILGQKKVCGNSNYTVKVDSYLLVYLMHLLDPEYTWTCEGYHDEYFSAEECKDTIPSNAVVGFAYGQSLFLEREFRYPLIWDK